MPREITREQAARKKTQAATFMERIGEPDRAEEFDAMNVGTFPKSAPMPSVLCTPFQAREQPGCNASPPLADLLRLGRCRFPMDEQNFRGDKLRRPRREPVIAHERVRARLAEIHAKDSGPSPPRVKSSRRTLANQNTDIIPRASSGLNASRDTCVAVI
jgi:hypothetical protein